MFKHLFTISWNDRRQNLWLIGGLFVISASLWYAVDYIYSIGVNQNKSLGFDWHHVYKINVDALTPESPKFKSDTAHTVKAGEDLLVFLDRLKQHPAVESVCLTQYHLHYEWTNSSATQRADTFSVNVLYRIVTPDYFNVFRVRGADGSLPEELAGKAVFTDLILTQRTAERLFPDGRAVGKNVFDTFSGDSVRISAVAENQKYNEYITYSPAAYRIFNRNDLTNLNVRDVKWYGCYIRVRPEADGENFVRTFRKEMRAQLMIGNLYLKNMRPVSDVRDEHLKDNRNTLYTHITVIVFFLLNAFLAVLGTFWSRTQQRRSELALRLALGSSRKKINVLLQAEGVFLLTISYILAMVLAWNLGVADLVETWPVEFTFTRFAVGALIAYVLLVIIVLIGIWYPSRQAMKIQPAEALHEE